MRAFRLHVDMSLLALARARLVNVRCFITQQTTLVDRKHLRAQQPRS